jgi:hypothetical protein
MDEGQLIGGTAAGQRYAAVGALADETNGTFCNATLVTKNVIVTVMYRKFKPPFFCPELYRRTREPSSARAFNENPGVASDGSGDAAVRSARLARRRCARSNSERAAAFG